jgi:hypothetical protein
MAPFHSGGDMTNLIQLMVLAVCLLLLVNALAQNPTTGNWSAPVDLGATVNTTSNEI